MQHIDEGGFKQSPTAREPVVLHEQYGAARVENRDSVCRPRVDQGCKHECCAHGERRIRISVAMACCHDSYQFGENLHSHMVAAVGRRLWGDQAAPLALFRAGA